MRIFQENTSETCKRLKKMAWSVKILTYEGPVFFSPSEICPNLLYFSCTYADDFCRKKINSVKAIVTSGHPHYINLKKIDVYRNFVEK